MESKPRNSMGDIAEMYFRSLPRYELLPLPGVFSFFQCIPPRRSEFEGVVDNAWEAMFTDLGVGAFRTLLREAGNDELVLDMAWKEAVLDGGPLPEDLPDREEDPPTQEEILLMRHLIRIIPPRARLDWVNSSCVVQCFLAAIQIVRDSEAIQEYLKNRKTS